MPDKITKPVLLAAVLGTGLALGSAGLALATAAPIDGVHAKSAPTTTITTITPTQTTTTAYPPTPTATETEVELEIDPRETEFESDRDEDDDALFNRNQSFVDVEVDDRGARNFHNNFRSPEEHGEELPFTGAPLSTLAAAGAGLLLLGAAGTIIAVRRRRTASAK
ncbi:hypothetical protein [Nonomuraea helvata]|uniref:Gram-positive cocci surface proteins LPxTG domain-containing protein n=1 Tax=Nonomuraea helvata TaxID=37484 RepID=A0ABV5S6L6_9ACTN